MPHLTPPEEHIPIEEAQARLTEIQELLAAAAEIGAIEDTPPGLRYEYLWQARAAAKALEWALSRAAGEAERQCEAAALARGLECCGAGCGRWLGRSELVRQDSGGSNEARRTHWWACCSCLGNKSCIDRGGLEEPTLKGDEP